MAYELSESAKRVQEFLSARGFSFEVKELPGLTRTAQQAADSVGCSVSQIAKSLIFKDKDTGLPVLVIASGSNRVDPAKIEKKTGLKLVKADGNYVKERVGFAIGGVPPAGHKEPLETILDAEAGTPFAVFQLSPADLEPLTNGRWIDLKEQNADMGY
jgi:prolyl-tRNA editing enzyme YbaK/EbsC (Cys-tRNA(Pro) deacylase)